MEKIIKVLKDNIISITCVNERWYIKSTPIMQKDEESGEEIQVDTEYRTVPSVTWICSYYPKGIAFHKWLANHGWDESQAIKESAGNKGSKVHLAINDLLDGKEIKMNDSYPNRNGDMEELSVDEYECIMSFVDWHKEFKPKVLGKEMVLFNDEMGCAGTIDLWCEIVKKVKIKEKGKKERIEDVPELWVIDYKISQNIWPEHKLQVSAYKHMLMRDKLKEGETFDKPLNLGILQLGYKRNKNKRKFNIIEDHIDTFNATQIIWANETKGIEPKQKDYPMSLKLEEGKDEHTTEQRTEGV